MNKKRFIIAILIIFICIEFVGCNKNRGKYLYCGDLPNVYIEETFTGDVDDIIDEFISRYVERTELKWPDNDEIYLAPSKKKQNG